MLYLIGLGLGDEKDITVRGLEIVRQCSKVYLEGYTAQLNRTTKHELESFYQCQIHGLSREHMESGCDSILQMAAKLDVAVLVVGDPLNATTHHDILLRAREINVPTRCIGNASIVTAVASTGLHVYKFGQIISLVFFHPGASKPTSFYDRLNDNARAGLHSLILLDIRIRELTLYGMMQRERMRNRRNNDTVKSISSIYESDDTDDTTNSQLYEPPQYMSVNCAARQLCEVEAERNQNICGPETPAVGVARLGTVDEQIVAGTLAELINADLGPPLHSLILVGADYHDLELQFLKPWVLPNSTFMKECEKARLDFRNSRRTQTTNNVGNSAHT